jgi:hypothetical protein
MSADPEPEDAVAQFDPKRPMVNTNPDGPIPIDSLEV